VCGKERGKDLLRGWGVCGGAVGARARGGGVNLDGLSSWSCACRWAQIPSRSLLETVSRPDLLLIKGHRRYYGVDDEKRHGRDEPMADRGEQRRARAQKDRPDVPQNVIAKASGPTSANVSRLCYA
jgi:hypothetical protein